MAKSNHFPGLLLFALVCIHFCIAGNVVKNKEQKIRSQEQRAKIKDFSRVKLGSSGFKDISREGRKGSQEQRAKIKDFSRVNWGSSGFRGISREGRTGSQEQRAKIKDFSRVNLGSSGFKGIQEQRAKIKDFSRVNLESSAFDGISREGWITKVKRIYDSQVGVREQGTNGGPQVEKYLRYVNLSKGNPWCAAFVCWVFGQAEVGNPKSGWSPYLFPASKIIWEKGAGTRIKEQRLLAGALREEGTRIKEQRFPPSAPYVYPTGLATCLPARQASNPQLETPTTGDVFALYFPEKKRIAHVGFIDSWEDNWLITVEGNTNESGAREGDGVYRKRRLIRSIYRVARYLY